MPRIGGKRKKTRTHLPKGPEGANTLGEGPTEETIPKSIIVKTSKVAASLIELVKDLRNLMSPNTASNVKEKTLVLGVYNFVDLLTVSYQTCSCVAVTTE
jgi:ribosome biogenesis protein SSF1/2